MHDTSTKHMQDVKRAMRYLEGTIQYRLFLKRGSLVHITTFADFDWVVSMMGADPPRHILSTLDPT